MNAAGRISRTALLARAKKICALAICAQTPFVAMQHAPPDSIIDYPFETTITGPKSPLSEPKKTVTNRL